MKPLKIYISGPYRGKNKIEIAKNIKNADKIAKEIAKLGHFPFIPHKMIDDWQFDPSFSFKKVLEIDLQWLKICDAIFLIAPSKGANYELKEAKKLGLKVFTDLSQIPRIHK
ncbi:MAG: hypothetical protein A3A08_00605 [Candidatus Nealsonbacteria bacterium RIFCSPLOWO2_01_FULL_41_9]|uniref:DUF7768 domain-containing protein n=1 Tax=Candidatus Nealsonbacteria bacterium RIFCSPLOWO2_01_FULL_41_9 TaxID=1801671 RepID=A0A1G2EDK8_9BACT|nr:MAG: hypothetical protein A3A08_00605 [Candidatus Nealsonbacteria bacterium RIFCSPLOWO2_01_FULL_41_9]